MHIIIQESANECTKCVEKDLQIRKLEEEAALAKGGGQAVLNMLDANKVI